MGAIDITFAKDDSSVFAFVGRAWLVDEPNVSKLRNWLKKELGIDAPTGMEIVHPEHPKSDLLAKWLEEHGVKFVQVGDVLLPDGRVIPAAIPETGSRKLHGLVVAGGFEPLLQKLSLRTKMRETNNEG